MKTLGGFRIRSRGKQSACLPSLYSLLHLCCESIFLRRRAGRERGWEPGAGELQSGAVRQMLSNSHCCAKGNERKSPGEASALDTN